MKIIVDMMGGDNAPLAVLEGAAQAVKEYGITVVGVGDEALVRKTAQENSIPLDGIELVNCTEVIDMCDEPARAIRQKKDSSIVVGLNMLKDGKGDAFVSAGSTGALVVGGTLIVKRIKGVKRPAIGTVVPCKDGCFMMLDSGANHDCRPEMLRQFGLMGSVYMKRILGVPNPRVGLVNIGVEETKGTELQVEAYGLMKEAGYNFIGNVEAREVPLGGCDVAVCDGFTGNIILKTTEGLAKLFMSEIKGIFMKSLPNKLAAAVVKKDLGAFKRKFDSAEYGGALLLGTKITDPKLYTYGVEYPMSAIENLTATTLRNIIGEMESQLAVETAEAE